MKKHVLNKNNLIFPLGLVIFQMTVFICNDLIQPAMLSVVQYFHVSDDWAPYSMSLFLIGGAIASALIGPIADRFGRRPVTLIGIAYFILMNLAITLSYNVEGFMSFRFLHGVALCFVTVGMVSVQEYFDEINAIKVQALLSNISLLAPLAGPVLGALLISFTSWHVGFIIIALVSLGSLICLYYKMPETLDKTAEKPSITSLLYDYFKVSTHIPFLIMASFLYLLSVPMLTWIAMSPIFLVKDLGYSNFGYGMAQFPIFMALMLGNFTLAKVVDRYPLGRTVYIATPLVLFSGGLLFIWTWFNPLTGMSYIIAQSILCFAQGIMFSIFYRLILMSIHYPRATIAGMMSLLSNLVQALGIMVLGYIYSQYGLATFYYAIGGLTFIMGLFLIPTLRWLQKQRG